MAILGLTESAKNNEYSQEFVRLIQSSENLEKKLSILLIDDNYFVKESSQFKKDLEVFNQNYEKLLHSTQIGTEYHNKLHQKYETLNSISLEMISLKSKELELKQTFAQYTAEEKLYRHLIDENIITNDALLVDSFGDLKYYSKEALYQYRDSNHIEKWNNAIDNFENLLIQSDHNNKQFLIKQVQSYRPIANVLADNTLRLQETQVMLTQHISDYQKLLMETLELNENIITSLHTGNQILFNDIILILIGFIISIAVTSMLLTIMFSNNISKPIIEIQKAYQNIASGKLDSEISIDSSKNDEMTVLKHSFNNMVRSLKQILSLEEALSNSRERLKNEKMESIGMLSARLAHDLRNPLGVIKGSVEILKISLSSEKSQKHSVTFERITRSIERMTHQIDEVLEFVKSSPPKLEVYNVKDIIDNVIDYNKIPKEIKIHLQLDNLYINCDPLKIEVVLNNLIKNSFQAMGDSGTIYIKAIHMDDNLILSVTDSGPGIPEEVLPKVFDPLFTTKQTGTGLGLASCKNIVELHNGTITVSNNPTTFTITIPLATESLKLYE